MTDYTELIEQYQEINPANYGPDDVDSLNAWGIEAFAAIEALQARVAELEDAAFVSRGMLRLAHGERDAALAKLKELEAQASVGWLISYEYLASTENIDGSLKKFKENWIESSFLSEFKDADIDATKYRNRRETPLFTRPIPALTARTYMDGYSDGKAWALEEAAKICDSTPPHPFRPSIEAAWAIRKLGEGL